VDLTVRSGVSVEDALTEAKRLEADRQEVGFDQVALETAAWRASIRSAEPATFRLGKSEDKPFVKGEVA
jgi:hypothetical protein